MTTGPRLQLALLLYTTFNIIVFTAAVYAATIFPPLVPNAGFWIAAITGVSLFLTAPLVWCLGACVPHEWHDKLLARQSPLSRAPTRQV